MTGKKSRAKSLLSVRRSGARSRLVNAMARCVEKVKKKPPLLMRERKRDYAGACGQIHHWSYYRPPACKSTDFTEFFLRNSADGHQHPPGLHSGPKLEGATPPGRVHYRQGRTGGATSDNVVFRAQPSEGGTSEATSARTAGPSVRRHGTQGPGAARTGRPARSRNVITPVKVRTYGAASLRRRGLPAGGTPRVQRQEDTGRYVHTSIPKRLPGNPGLYRAVRRPFIENDALHH
jgi:hypothetical protein